MTHRDVIPLLPDMLEARLDEAAAAAAWSHVAECAECRQAITAMYQVRRAVVAGGAAVFAAHPSSDDLVRFALVDADLPTPDLARLGDHVRACDACREAVELTRRAERETSRPALGRLIDFPAARRAAPLAPALAALAILAWPAYVGLVRYPAAERARGASAARAATLETERRRAHEALEAEQRAARDPGPTRLLYLPAIVRGEAPAPEVAVDPGQRWQPIVIQHRPFDGAPAGSIEIAIVPEGGTTPAWRETRDAAAFWDAEHEALVALAPATAVRPGTHRLEVRRDGALTYSASFRTLERNP